MRLEKAIDKYAKYADRVITILKRKCPDIEFDSAVIVAGFVNGFSPSIVVEGLIKAYKTKSSVTISK